MMLKSRAGSYWLPIYMSLLRAGIGNMREIILCYRPTYVYTAELN